jgi:acetyl esterase/lipase
MFPPDEFNLEYGDMGNPSERVVTHDLMYAGFLVFQVEHRLAPPRKLPGQPNEDLGQAPEQTDDSKRQILAALADPQCNGSIYLVGGSAGGCMALWCALDSASTVTGWDESVREKVKAVVSMSGVTDPSDWSHPDLLDYMNFEYHADNYVGLTYPDYDYTTLRAAAAVGLILDRGATSSPPTILVASQFDTVSHTQAEVMRDALTSIGTIPTYVYFPGSSNHAYNNWHQINPNTANCLSADIIDFLLSHP